MRKWRRKRNSSRGKQSGDGSGRRERFKPDTGTALSKMSKSWDSDSPRKGGGMVSFSGKHSLMAVVEDYSRLKCRRDTDERSNDYSQTGFAIYDNVYKKETGGSGEEKLIVGSAQLFDEQGVEYMVTIAKKSAEPQECQQGKRKTCQHGFYSRPVFSSNKVAECPLLRKMNFTSQEVMSHRALSKNRTS